jgi:hypothetical protein
MIASLLQELWFKIVLRHKYPCSCDFRKTVIDTLPPLTHNRKWAMVDTDPHGMREEFSFLQVWDSQQVNWLVKGFVY